MCCIFTCCGWLIDLMQRCWTFTMSCIISSAVCCSLLTAAVSGVALGYNYSLAEYIDLKETNVSVYLKRGIFDDEISDEMEWRRSGHKPIRGHIREDNLITGSSADEYSTLRSGRRLDDSIFQADDKNKFEDSLMRLTAKAPDFVSTEASKELIMGDIAEKYPHNSLEQLKAIQSVINMRKMKENTISSTFSTTQTPYQEYIRKIPNPAVYPSEEQPMRRMQFDAPTLSTPFTISSLRKAVPDTNINDPIQWVLPKVLNKAYPKGVVKYYGTEPTYPSPIPSWPVPVRPTRPKLMELNTKHVPGPIRTTQTPEHNIPKSIDEEIDPFKEKFMMQNGDFSRLEGKKIKQKDFIDQKENDDDYEDENIKGVPLRKKRNIFKLQDYIKYKQEDKTKQIF